MSDQKDDLVKLTIGDGATGKTCLFTRYVTGEFPREYVPTIYEAKDISITQNGKVLSLHLEDVPVNEDIPRLASFWN
jgi:GTPase SAR1 family protein